MYDRSPFQQFIPPRIGRLISRLNRRIWQPIADSDLTVQRTQPTREHTPFEDLKDSDFEPVTDTPIFWGKKFDHCWWKMHVPAHDGSTRRYLHWTDQGEATAWLNGEPWGGIDPAHRYLPLPDEAVELYIESICSRTGIWVGGGGPAPGAKGSQFDGASLMRRDDATWKLGVDLAFVLELAKGLHRKEYPLTSDLPASGGYREPIEKASPLLRTVLHELEQVADAYHRQGVEAAADRMEQAFEKLRGAEPGFDITLTGHAHIDLVWLWPENAGEFKAVHTFSNVLLLQQEYPELVFGYSQPASYEAVQRRSPKLMDAVREAMASGKWEATGATYVESDTQLACGEALARAFELGQAGFAAMHPRGKASSVLWIPDVFGYSGVIPTLMKAYDVEGFFTTKMTWSGATRFPHTSFVWRGNDGSEVLTHLAPQNYNGRAKPAEIELAATGHRQSHVHPEALHCIGYGDGGGGPTAEMCQHVRRLADLRGLHPAKWGTIEGFFDRLAQHKAELPLWQGEMYLEFHRGVQTTHGHLKAAFRRLERNLQVLEAVHCATGAGPVDEYAWKRAVFAQFHDYIPGSSVLRVIEDTVPELESLGDGVMEDAGRILGGAGEACLFNPLPFEQTVLDADQHVTLPALSGVAIAAANSKPAQPVQASSAFMDNGQVRVEFDAQGRVTLLADQRGPIAINRPISQLAIAPDYPCIYDAWDIDRSALHLAEPIEEASHVRCNTDDPFAPTVQFDFVAGENRITTVYRLRAGATVVEVEHHVDWAEPERLLLCLHPTSYQSRNARYGAPFGSCLRTQQSGSLAVDAMFEVPASRWAAIANDVESDGLMIITEAKYGFGCIDGLMHLSLVRSASITGQPPEPANARKNYSDIGSHVIRSAIGVYRADAPRAAQPAALADALYTEPIAYTGQPLASGLLDVTGSPSVVPAWAKPLDDGGLLVRLHETLGAQGKVKLKLADGFVAKRADIRGNVTGLLQDRALAVGPYAVQSVLIERASAAR